MNESLQSAIAIATEVLADHGRPGVLIHRTVIEALLEAVESGASSPVTASEAGRRGGSKRTPAQIAASKANIRPGRKPGAKNKPKIVK